MQSAFRALCFIKRQNCDMEKKDIAVIGAGASGLMAACQAAEKGARVVLYEQNLICGRKLAVTGSGRCNITNRLAAADRYQCVDPSWLSRVFRCFGVKDLEHVCDRLGVPLYATSDGWYYPLSDSGQSVAAAFSEQAVLAGAEVRTSCPVTAVRKTRKGFLVSSGAESAKPEEYAALIVSSGGGACPQLGSGTGMLSVLNRLGHTVLPLRPALAPLDIKLNKFKKLSGTRFDVAAGVWRGETCLARSKGNLIFTDRGMNGPAVMDVSWAVSAYPGEVLDLKLDLLADCETEFRSLWQRRKGSRSTLGVTLGAFFAPKTVSVLLQAFGLNPTMVLADGSAHDLNRLESQLRNLTFQIEGTRGFEFSQISAGGVPVTEVNPETMESRLVPDLYLTGELLDVTGPCGGYNLQFAFSSGAVAGRAAAG